MAMDLQIDIDSFIRYLCTCQRILVLVGAGLSAPSGIPTFRGADGIWRDHTTKELASPYKFRDDPVMVWQFYSERRHRALTAQPNPAHHALAKLAQTHQGVVTVSQNVDGLLERAQHPASQLHLIHGSLFHIRCTACDYFRSDDFTIPQHPDVAASELPRCPVCRNLLRPGVVWFGERLPDSVTYAIDAWVSAGPVDLILVIGTSLTTFPAAEYLDIARTEMTRVAVVNLDRDDEPHSGMRLQDWFFESDASVIVPKLLQDTLGSTRFQAKYLDVPSVANEELACNFSDPGRVVIRHTEVLTTNTIDHNTASDDDLVLFCETPGREFVGGNPRLTRLSAQAIAKVGGGVNKEEADNQRRAYQLLHPNIVRVPQVYRYFEREKYVPPEYFKGQQLHPGYTSRVGYLIMEYVAGDIAEPDQYSALAADMSVVLERFHRIQGARPGPADGGVSRGMFWEDDFPAFGSKADLEDWIHRRTLSSDTKISLEFSPLVFCHMDLTPRNILRLQDQSLCLLDWASAGFYPRVFELAVLQLRPLAAEEELFNERLSQSILLSEAENAHLGMIKQAWRNSQTYAFAPTAISHPPHPIVKYHPRKRTKDKTVNSQISSTAKKK